MHDQAYRLMQQFAPKAPWGATIVDIGAYDVNGNLRELFGSGYIGVDIIAGPNVDVVMPDPLTLPFEDASVDVIVSANCFEHVAMPWLLALEIDRVLKPGGLLAIAAPLMYQHHDPPDYWRFSHEGLELLFTRWLERNGHAAYEVFESYVNERRMVHGLMNQDTWLHARKPGATL